MAGAMGLGGASNVLQDFIGSQVHGTSMSWGDVGTSFGLGVLGGAIGGPFTKVPKYGAYPTAASREMVNEGNAVREMRANVTLGNAVRNMTGGGSSAAAAGCN
jgi:hypothetical protein